MLLFPDNIPLDQLPSITIIIANYNYGQYVTDAINSALNQKYPKLIIMIVDDLSTDDSRIKIDTLLKEKCSNPETHKADMFDLIVADSGDIEVVYIKLKRHINVSAARNLAIDLSLDKTDYYMILDADDIAYENKTTELAAAMFGSAFIGVVYGDYHIHNLDNDTTLPEFKEPYSRRRLEQECIVHSGAMIRKQALIDTKDEFGYYDYNMRTCEDYDLWMRISEKYMLVHVPQLLSLVRVHRKNSTNVISGQEWQTNWRRIVEKTRVRNAKAGI